MATRIHPAAHEVALTCERALELILEGARPLDAEVVPLEEADGRAAAEEVRAARRLPAWDNSAKDGYAVAREDLRGLAPGVAAAGGVSLPVAGEIPAGGAPGSRLATGKAMRIMTGAPLPLGADAVVQVEDSEGPEGRGCFAAVGERVTFFEQPPAGGNVRPAGADVAAGDVVLERGTALTPGRIALLAALGKARVAVHRRPCVSVIPTGDELVEPGRDAPPGRLYSSNAHGLAALIRRAGGVPRMAPIVPDDRGLIRSAVHEALESSEVVVTSGGVSAGAHDHVRGVIGEAAGGIVFWGVRMRPGEPLVFARAAGPPDTARPPARPDRPASSAARYLFGLPGNPTSALVTFLEFVRPLLRRLAGFADIFLPTVRATLAERVRSEPGRRSFIRVRLWRDGAGGFVAAPSGGQGSGLLLPLAEADGLLISGPERTDYSPGAVATIQLLDLPAAPRDPYGL